MAEGAEIIIGPLFAHSVGAVGAVARQRGVPVIAFSTDANVAARGVYLLSFLPESDVDRIVDYAVANGKRSFAAMLSEDAYGTVVEAEFKQVVARKGGRIVALERYALDADAGCRIRRSSSRRRREGADAVFIPGGRRGGAVGGAGADGGRPAASACSSSAPGCGTIPASSAIRRCRAAGTRRPTATASAISHRAIARAIGQDPVRTATLAYDAVALVAALVKTQGAQRFSEQVLTNPSGFAGIDGLFRFRTDGTNERGLAVMRVTPGGGQVISPPPRAFGGSGI